MSKNEQAPSVDLVQKGFLKMAKRGHAMVYTYTGK